MKKLDLVQSWDELQRKRDHVVAIQTMLLQQIGVIEKLMENNSDCVQSPASYNACVGLLEQLKTHAFASFCESTGTAPQIPDGNTPMKINVMHGL